MVIGGSIIIECFDKDDNKLYDITKNLKPNNFEHDRVEWIRVSLIDESGRVIKHAEFFKNNPFDMNKFVYQAIIDARTFITFVDNEKMYEAIECAKDRCENYMKLPKGEK